MVIILTHSLGFNQYGCVTFSVTLIYKISNQNGFKKEIFMTAPKEITPELLLKLRRKNGEINKTKTDTAVLIGIGRKTWEPIINGNKQKVSYEVFNKLEKWLNA